MNDVRDEGKRDPDDYNRISGVSPTVHADRRVTFSVLAPEAQSVRLVSGGLSVELSGEREMTREANGVWSITVGPLRPDLYDYGFSIGGGLRTPDTLNPDIETLRWGSLSLVDVPGDKPHFFEYQGDPAGRVHAIHYHSPIVDDVRRYLAYTPPEYDERRETCYPVLYLLHGSGQLEDTWYATGRMNYICDNLIARGRLKPLVVIMPYGHLTRAVSPQEPARTSSDYGVLEKIFFEEIIPHAEENFRISSRRQERAIAGLSMGSNQARVWAFSHHALFASVGIFSNRRPAEELTDLPLLNDPATDTQRLPSHCFLAMGEGEEGNPGWHALADKLEKAGLAVEQHVYPGNHSFVCWRRCLRDYLPVAFPKGATR